MSEEQLKAFLEKVNADSNLQEKLKSAKSPEQVVSIAREIGYELSANEIIQLREEDLEGVAGGNASDEGVAGAACYGFMCI